MQSILFSVYCGLTVSICYKLSRGSSNPTVLWNIIKSDVFRMKTILSNDDGIEDPLPETLKIIVKQRLQSDILLCFLIFILVFAAHASTTFTSLQVCLFFFFRSLLSFFLSLLANSRLYYLFNRYYLRNILSLYPTTTSKTITLVIIQ